MIELIKKEIHMNRQKGTAVSQLTLDDDFIVPDALDDAAQILLSDGEVQIENSRIQGEKVLIRGKLVFRVLYRRESGGLQAMGGEIPFEETVNVPELSERDYTQIAWNLEDLNITMIHSRKLSAKAVLTLTVRAESRVDAQAAADVETDDAGLQVLKRSVPAATLAVRRKDIYRVREEVSVSANKPNIETILWQEMRLRDVSVRPLDGKLHLDGELSVFLIYSGEGEESIPFSGEVELSEAAEEMIPAVGVRILHAEADKKPDSDGEMREVEVEAVLELDIRLYKEESVELLSDLYSTGCEVVSEQGEVCFDRLLTRNSCKMRVGGTVSFQKPERILQICHSSGIVRLDESRPAENGLAIEGVLEISLLYLTDDDAAPVGAISEVLPFSGTVEAEGIREDSVWQLNLGLEQLGAVMLGGGEAEVKAQLTVELLVFQPMQEEVVTSVQTQPFDLKRWEQQPGIVGYIVQPGDSLWKIAKKFHTTVDQVREMNEIAGEEAGAGARLLLIKEVTAGNCS